MGNVAKKLDNRPLYERDYYAWVQSQVQALESRKFDEIDFANLADEVGDLGKSERRQVVSRLEIIMLHMLKCLYQPEMQTPSWDLTIKIQRIDLSSVLSENPSLKSLPVEAFERTYQRARLEAAKETGMDLSVFPTEPPFTPAQVVLGDAQPDAL